MSVNTRIYPLTQSLLFNQRSTQKCLHGDARFSVRYNMNKMDTH